MVNHVCISHRFPDHLFNVRNNVQLNFVVTTVKTTAEHGFLCVCKQILASMCYSLVSERYVNLKVVKAKFHYAIWSQTGPKLVANLLARARR